MSPQRGQDARDSGKARILVIEDDTPMRRFLRAALSNEGYQVVEAETGQAGLTSLLSHIPDLILLDLGLPDMDGTSILERVREWSRVPIVVLSARGQEADKVDALNLGADDYLSKPFGVPELLARILVALRHATQLRDAAGERAAKRGRESESHRCGNLTGCTRGGCLAQSPHSARSGPNRALHRLPLGRSNARPSLALARFPDRSRALPRSGR